MLSIHGTSISIFLSVFLLACSHTESYAPKSHQPNGIVGTIEYKPTDWKSSETSWWKDSDGVNPGIAGCHLGTDDKGILNGRMFGEACLENGLLVESNPDKDAVHSHKNDLGHPNTVDCNAWCISSGKNSGACVAAAAPPCNSSAKCNCR